MTFTAFLRVRHPFINLLWVAVTLGFFVLITNPVLASEDPFDFDTAHWMSFDRYKEKTKNKANFNPAQTQDADTAQDAPAQQSTDAKALDGTTAGVITPPTMTPIMAPPTRPINIPVMPGVNKGYAVHVSSTEDDKPPVAQITDIETAPKIELPTKNWQSPKSHVGPADANGENDDERQALDVRMSFLPNSQIKPIPSPEYKSNHGRKADVAAAEAKPEVQKSNLAASAAVDAFKKRQLQALESDRQTLADLQKAIVQLGLQKKLSFMTGTQSNMNQADTSTLTVNAPPSLIDLKKN